MREYIPYLAAPSIFSNSIIKAARGAQYFTVNARVRRGAEARRLVELQRGPKIDTAVEPVPVPADSSPANRFGGRRVPQTDPGRLRGLLPCSQRTAPAPSAGRCSQAEYGVAAAADRATSYSRRCH